MESKQIQTVYIPTERDANGIMRFKKQSGYFFTPEELEEYKKRIVWDTLYDPCENCGGGHIRPCNHCGDLGYHRKYHTPEELNKLKREVAEKALWWMSEYAVTPDATTNGIANYLNTNYPIL